MWTPTAHKVTYETTLRFASRGSSYHDGHVGAVAPTRDSAPIRRHPLLNWRTARLRRPRVYRHSRSRLSGGTGFQRDAAEAAHAHRGHLRRGRPRKAPEGLAPET